jgi:hypothetical protein
MTDFENPLHTGPDRYKWQPPGLPPLEHRHTRRRNR